MWKREAKQEHSRVADLDPTQLEGPALPPPVEVRETDIPGSDLRYYQPFTPLDSIYDAWLKFQGFTSDHPIRVRVTPSDEAAPILSSSFLPDGRHHSTNEMFFLDLAAAIRSKGGPGAWRGVRQLSWFGLPASTREGAYHIFTGTMRMELTGVPIMGLNFSVAVTFEPNLGWIPGHFADRREYFHCEVANEGRNVVVGFPWCLTAVTLKSQDVILPTEAPKIARGIIGKYERYVLRNQALTPTLDDATRRLTVISDGAVVIEVQEGTVKDRKFLRIDYGPSPKGPIDEIALGDAEFTHFAREIAENRQEWGPAKEEVSLNTPF